MKPANFALALAFSLTAAAPTLAHADPACGTAVADLHKEWTKSDKFGDDNFGAAYNVGASITGRRDGLAIEGHLQADALLFGDDKDIVTATASAEGAVVGRSAKENIDVFVLGRNIFHHSRATGTSDGGGVPFGYSHKWDVTFFNASKRFMVGPVPVKVKGTANGSASINFNSNIGVFAVDASLTPAAEAYASASASADILLAEAGVDGTVTLVKASVPTTGNLNLTTAGLAYKLDSDLALNYLQGRMNLFAKLLGKRHEKKIADWSGTTRNIAISHETGCVNLF